MISDERLKAFAEYDDELAEWQIVDVFNEVIPEIAKELLQLRTFKSGIEKAIEEIINESGRWEYNANFKAAMSETLDILQKAVKNESLDEMLDKVTDENKHELEE